MSRPSSLATALPLAVALAACGFSPSGASAVQDAPLQGSDARVDAPHAVDAPPAIDAAMPDAAMPDAAMPDAALPTVYQDCKDAFAQGIHTDGVQMIDPDGSGGNAPFNAYCDMTRAGGGWTLVWSYGFTDYANFSNGDNAVTPRPTWGFPTAPSTAGSPTPTSTTVPQSPTMLGALDFPRWGKLDGEFMVASNINHTVRCVPATASPASLSGLTAGTITCSFVTKIAGLSCQTILPTRLTILTSAPGLFAASTYYFWEAATTTGNWPTHDPCGNNAANQATGVANPGGQVYLRRL